VKIKKYYENIELRKRINELEASLQKALNLLESEN